MPTCYIAIIIHTEQSYQKWNTKCHYHPESSHVSYNYVFLFGLSLFNDVSTCDQRSWRCFLIFVFLILSVWGLIFCSGSCLCQRSADIWLIGSGPAVGCTGTNHPPIFIALAVKETRSNLNKVITLTPSPSPTKTHVTYNLMFVLMTLLYIWHHFTVQIYPQMDQTSLVKVSAI